MHHLSRWNVAVIIYQWLLNNMRGCTRVLYHEFTMATQDQEVYTEFILDRAVPQLLTAFTAAFSTATSKMQAEAAIMFVYNYVINEIYATI